jgi:hypothetical protein
MSEAALQTIVRQIEQLEPEEKWTLLSLITESLRRQCQPVGRTLGSYYGRCKGRGLQTVQEVDSFIREERDSWEE